MKNKEFFNALTGRIGQLDYVERIVKAEDEAFIREIEKIKALDEKARQLIIRADKFTKTGEQDKHDFFMGQAVQILKIMYNEQLKAGKEREVIRKIEEEFEQFKNNFIQETLQMIKGAEQDRYNRTTIKPENIKKNPTIFFK